MSLASSTIFNCLYLSEIIHICLSEPGLLHLAQCSPGPSVLLQMAAISSFLRLVNIPLYVYAIFSLSIYLAMSI